MDADWVVCPVCEQQVDAVETLCATGRVLCVALHLCGGVYCYRGPLPSAEGEVVAGSKWGS
jgi:hypothetical protein